MILRTCSPGGCPRCAIPAYRGRSGGDPPGHATKQMEYFIETTACRHDVRRGSTSQGGVGSAEPRGEGRFWEELFRQAEDLRHAFNPLPSQPTGGARLRFPADDCASRDSQSLGEGLLREAELRPEAWQRRLDANACWPSSRGQETDLLEGQSDICPDTCQPENATAVTA